MPFSSMMDFYVVGPLVALTLVACGFAAFAGNLVREQQTEPVRAIEPGIQHTWVFGYEYGAHKPLVTYTGPFPVPEVIASASDPLAIEAPATDTGTYDISALPSRV